MDTHKNAPLTPRGREAMVRCVINGGLSKAAAARQFNTDYLAKPVNTKQLLLAIRMWLHR